MGVSVAYARTLVLCAVHPATRCHLAPARTAMKVRLLVIDGTSRENMQSPNGPLQGGVRDGPRQGLKTCQRNTGLCLCGGFIICRLVKDVVELNSVFNCDTYLDRNSIRKNFDFLLRSLLRVGIFFQYEIVLSVLH